MVEVYLYGRLRRFAADPRPSQDSVVRLEPQLGETVRTTLERLGISPDEVFHVFLNGALLSTHNSMAPWLRYRRVGKGKGLDTPVQAGDRVGLFARDMALLVV
jgi:molybdopterin converting factor small subunit